MGMFNGKVTQEKVARLPSPRHDQVNGLLDKGCSFEGKLTFDGTVQINGDFRGEIFSDGTLVVGTEAHVEAKIYVGTLIIYGKVQGHIEAKTRIEMHVPAMVTADLKSKHLSIEDGVIFQGTCQMERQAEATEAAVESTDAQPRLRGFLPDNDDANDSVLVG